MTIICIDENCLFLGMLTSISLEFLLRFKGLDGGIQGTGLEGFKGLDGRDLRDWMEGI